MARLKYVPVRLCAHPRSRKAAWAHKPAILKNRNVKNVQLFLRSDARERSRFGIVAARSAERHRASAAGGCGPTADAGSNLTVLSYFIYRIVVCDMPYSRSGVLPQLLLSGGRLSGRKNGKAAEMSGYFGSDSSASTRAVQSGAWMRISPPSGVTSAAPSSAGTMCPITSTPGIASNS